MRQPSSIPAGRTALTLLLSALMSFSSGLQASAHHDGIPYVGNPVCPHGGNYGSTACLLGVTHYGLYAEWHNNYMYVQPTALSAGAHINHGIWSRSGYGCDRWVEIGLTRGYYGNNWYGTYLGWNTKYGYDDAFLLPVQSWDGSNHKYYLKYEGAPVDEGRYSFWRDDSQIGYLDGLGFGSCIGQGGLEFSKISNPPDNRFHSDTFDLTPLKWQDTGYAWRTGWNINHWYIQYGCGQYPVPNCLNGVYYSASYWADNKP